MFVITGNKIFSGIDNELSIKSPDDNSFNKLDQFIIKNEGKYIICFLSYDLKNTIEDLDSTAVPLNESSAGACSAHAVQENVAASAK